MHIEIKIDSLQHIDEMKIELDFDNNDIICLVSNNGIGKTTLLKSLGMLYNTSVIQRTSSSAISFENSRISIKYDNNNYDFSYSREVNYLEYKGVIQEADNGLVELPIPYGDRYSGFSSLNEIDSALRAKYLLDDVETPVELVSFLGRVYKNDKFNNLKECSLNGRSYYFLPLGNNRYIREDFFSSGEYFIICLYRILTQSNKELIAIDEIDISLDASAQVSLVCELEKICKEKGKKILFTTHSLALMKTIESSDVPIMFLENDNGTIVANRRSYNFINGVMFGFSGYDKYILTEDAQLERYLNRFIDGINSINSCKVLYIGGCDGVVSLMKRNDRDAFLSHKNNVITVLDLDVKHLMDRKSEDVTNRILYIPFLSIEKELHRKYKIKDYRLPFLGAKLTDHKKIFERMVKKLSYEKVIKIVEKGHEKEIERFNKKIKDFINANLHAL